jgi:hypothetical protein
MKYVKRWACLIFPLFALIVCASAAQATEISGTISTTLTIYDDSELVDDVTCAVPPGKPCIEFGASDITLKLHGFTITGPANPPTTGCTPTFSPDDGIAVVGQHDVAILGPGLVQKFGRHGIFLGPATTRAKVKGVTASDNCFSGILINSTTDSVIEKNVLVRNAIGSQNFPCGGT